MSVLRVALQLFGLRPDTSAAPARLDDADRLLVSDTTVLARLPLATFLDRLKVADRYSADEYLPDQAGTGGVLLFDFLTAPDLVWVRSNGGNSRAAYGVNPTAALGVPCPDGEPVPITRSGATQLRVFAPVGATVSVYGLRYA